MTRTNSRLGALIQIASTAILDKMSVRFAPSPTGTFHIGNLRTGWIAQAWATSLQKPWIVRYEDIDTPRIVEQARGEQLQDLATIGLIPDILTTQSDNLARHWLVFCEFLARDWIYPCDCTRKDLRVALDHAASAPHQTLPSYTGRCRTRTDPLRSDLPSLAWRVRGDDAGGAHDIIIARTATLVDGAPSLKSFVPAYNWACAIDDSDGAHSLIVRAWDLVEMANPQRFIQKKLAELQKRLFAPPAIYHTALIVQDNGERLEKRTHGVTLAELLAVGWTPERLRDCFAKNLVLEPTSIVPGAILGETNRTLKLSELLSSL